MNNWNTDIESQVKDVKEMIKKLNKRSTFISSGCFSHD